MKTTFLFLAFSLLFINTSMGSNNHYGSDTSLNNIQIKIQNAFVIGEINQSDKELVTIEQSLLDLLKLKNNPIIVYWYSYTCYYHSIFFMLKKDNKNSENILSEGINRLNECGLKNSEDCALISLMKSLSLKFSSAVEIPSISESIKQNATRALDLDSLNLRAYYVLASNDFYTPKQYGGGHKTEQYLKKAISLNDQSTINGFLPSWGKKESYEMLIKMYILNKQFIEAKKYIEIAKNLFPNDYMIAKLSDEILKNSK